MIRKDVYDLTQEWVNSAFNPETSWKMNLAVSVNETEDEFFVTVYTDSPGQLIGRKGSVLFTYKEKLQQIPDLQSKKIRVDINEVKTFIHRSGIRREYKDIQERR